MLEPLLAIPYTSAIDILLAHALRHRMLTGVNTLQEALDSAARRQDRTLQWTYPEVPVFSAYRSPKSINSFDFIQVISTQFVDDALYDLNGISGFAKRFTTHDIRAGAARDLSFVPSNKILGVANTATAKALGHTRQSLNRGVTDSYIGALNQDLNQLKWEHQVEEDYITPRQGAPLRKKGVKIATAAIDKRLAEEPLDKKGHKRSRKAITRDLRQEAEKARLKSVDLTPSAITPPESISSTTEPSKRPSVLKTPLAPKTPSQINARQHPSPKSNLSTELEHASQSAYLEPDDDSSWSPYMTISKRAGLEVINGFLEGFEPSETTMQAIQDIEEDNALDAMVASSEQTAILRQDISMLLSPEFVDRLSRINVVDHSGVSYYAKDSIYAKTLELVESTNSRDPATPFLHTCSLCKSYTAFRRTEVAYHESTCLQVQEEHRKKPFLCEWNGCHKKFRTGSERRCHVLNTHERPRVQKTYIPRKCDIDRCDDQTIWPSLSGFNDHKRGHKVGFTSTMCLYPDCETKTLFGSIQSYFKHLARAYSVRGSLEDCMPYMPIGTDSVA